MTLQRCRPRLARPVPDPRGRGHAARARRGVLQGPATARALVGLAVAGSLASAIASIVLYRQLGAGAHARHAARRRCSIALIATRLRAVGAVRRRSPRSTALMSPAHQREHDWQMGEYYGVLLLSASGMVMLAHAANLVTVFLGIETMSIGVYVMTAMRRRSRRGNEAAMKYFLIGAFATGFLMYGMALLYGAAGTTSLAAHAGGARARPRTRASSIAGAFLLVVAFGFKIAAVPFHMWAPDAYEGAPTPVTAFMAAARQGRGDRRDDPRVRHRARRRRPPVRRARLGEPDGRHRGDHDHDRQHHRGPPGQRQAHARVLVDLARAACCSSASARSASARRPRTRAIVYYLIAYSFTTIGAFAVVAYVGSRGRERLLVDDWAGLGEPAPGAALAMTICLLSFGGIPPTGGFFGKFYIFKCRDGRLRRPAAVARRRSASSTRRSASTTTCASSPRCTSARRPSRSRRRARRGLLFVIALCPLLVLELGLMPGWWLRLIGSRRSGAARPGAFESSTSQPHRLVEVGVRARGERRGARRIACGGGRDDRAVGEPDALARLIETRTPSISGDVMSMIATSTVMCGAARRQGAISRRSRSRTRARCRRSAWQTP